MKIAVCGKGGSGKSTVVALLAKRFRKIGTRVLLIDSDESNSGLHWMLGFDRPPSPLMDFVGGKRRLQESMSARFSRGESEPEMSIFRWEEIPSADIPGDYMVESDGLRLVAIGKILQSLEGCACPMGTLSKEFLKKLRLEENEIAVVDMEAGIEHFGRGIETSIDRVVVVVEPSFESLSLAQKIKDLAISSGAGFTGAILNKVTSQEISSHLENELAKREVRIIGSIPYRHEIFSDCLSGQSISPASAEVEVYGIVKALQD